MTRLDNQEFLAKVASALDANNGKSSVYLSQKRLALAPSDLAGNTTTDITSIENKTTSSNSTISDLPSNVLDNATLTATPASVNPAIYPLLVRVSLNGSNHRQSKHDKIKLSTVVLPLHSDRFWSQYSQVLKNGFLGLKKKEKKKQKGKVSK